MGVWKDVVGFEGAYQVSDFGKVRSVPRVDSAGKARKGVLLKPWLDASGYEMVCFSVGDKKTRHKIHRLVATAFCAQPIGKDEVNHIDGVKTNNLADNLEWCTRSENALHAAHTIRKCICGVRGYDHESGVELVFGSIRDAMRAGYQNVDKVLSGQRQTCRGYRWERL